TAPTGTFALFGSAVATDGNRIVVGHRTANGRGAAHIYRIESSSVVFEQTIDDTTATNTNYGVSVAIEGDEVFVGGTGGAGMTAGAGRVMISKRTGNSWGAPVVLDGGSGSAMGSSIVVRGSKLFTGAFGSRGMTNVAGG